MADRLDQLQSFMDAGAVNQSNFNLNISNEQQLADMNDWLARLSNSIATGQMPQEPKMDPATTFAYNQMSNFNPPPQDYSQYPMVPSQQQMYPTSCEDTEMYVRSQPMPPVVPSQHYMAVNQFGQPYGPGLTGQRQHYTTIPNVSDQYFQPELRTTTNFTKANNPENGETEKEETDSFKPTKTMTHDEKKHMATLVNTFSSALDTSKKPVAKKEATVQTPPSRKKSDDLIRELIVSDLSKLSINDSTTVSTEEDDSISSNLLTEKDKNSSLYPTTNTNSNHIALLKKITQWMNENYHKSHSSTTMPLKEPLSIN